MTACILCPSTAVADCLCVECGAKLWAARLIMRAPVEASAWRPVDASGFARCNALDTFFRQAPQGYEVTHAGRAAVGFLAEYERAKVKRAANPCPRGCATHEDPCATE